MEFAPAPLNPTVPSQTEDVAIPLGSTAETPIGDLIPVGPAVPEQIAPAADPFSVEQKTQKTHFALGDDSPGPEVLRDTFFKRQDGVLRDRVALQEQLRAQSIKTQMISQAVATANRTGLPLTPEDEALIMSATAEQLQDPKTILEKLYARRMVNALTIMSAYNWQNTLQESLGENPDKTYNLLDAYQDIFTKQEIAQDLKRQADDEYKQVSWMQSVPETALQFVPGYTWYRFRTGLTGAGELSAMLGSKLEEYYERLYLLSPDQFRQQVLNDYNRIKTSNHSLAKQFMDGVVSFSTSSRASENAGTIFDVLDIATLGVGPAVKGLRASGRLANRLNAGLHANVNPAMELADALVAAGNVPAAADQKAFKFMGKVARGEDTFDDLIAQRFGMLDPQNYARNAGSLAAEQTRRLLDDLKGVTDNLVNATTTDRTLVLPRIEGPAVDAAYVQARVDWERNYPHLIDHIVDITPQRLSDKVYGGVDRLVFDIGRKDASTFEKPQQAQTMASLLRLSKGQYEIAERDGNFVIRMYKNVDETDPIVREARIATDNQTSQSRLNRWIGILRSPKDYLSKQHNTARDTATYGTNQILDYMRRAFESMGGMTNTQRDRIRTLLTDNQTELRPYLQPDGSTKMLPGNWYDTFADFEIAYMKRFGEMPSPKEYKAYFTIHTTSDWGFQMQKIGMMRDKLRVGGEQKALVFTEGKERKVSDFFEGRTIDKLPDWSAQPFTVATIDEKGKRRVIFSDRRTPQQEKLIARLIDEGYEILQPLNPNDEVLRGMFNSGGDVINYVLSKTTKTKPLDFDAQLQYRAGGHALYDPNSVFIKGLNSWKTTNGRRLYGGDVTLQAFDSPAQAEKFLASYEKVRQMIKDGKPNKAILDVLHNETPYRTIKEFKLLFKPDGGPLDWNGPLTVVRDGQRVSDKIKLDAFYKERVDDVSQNSHNPMASVNTRWTQERETLLTVNESGTQAQPLYNLVPVQMMDPIQALNRSAADLVRNRFFEDYKHRAVEDWVAQFRQVLNVPDQEAFGNPMRMLREAPQLWKDNIQNPELLNAAKNSRRAILQLLAQESPMKQQFKWLREKMLDAAYNKGGQSAVDKVKLTPDWLIGAQTDPVAFARARVFDAKLGLWNPLQLPLQAQSVIHAAAIDGNPIRAIQANLSSWMMRTYRGEDLNGKNVTWLGRVARKALGVSEDQFKEMYEGLRRSGMMNVEGEYSMLDDVFDPQVTPLGLGGRIWDSSRIFFREGERYVRMTAYNTAYLNWRQNNPLAKFTPEVERAIIRRADDLSLNMTRASNNPTLQQGPQSVMTQFMTYHARLSEQMLGGRLTAAEKARVMLAYSAAYGVPLGVGGTTLGLFAPVYESYRKYAIENGYDLSDWKFKAFAEGIPSLALAAVTGQDVNWAQRYGPGGMSFFKDLLFDGKVSVLLGPAGSFVMDVLKHHEPFTHTLVSLVDPKANERWPVTAEDFMEMFREVSVVNNAASGLVMWNTGKLITQGEVVMGDVDKRMALFRFITGMQPQFATDAWLTGSVLRDQNKAKAELEKDILKHMQRAFKSWSDGNNDDAEIHATKARVRILAAGFDEIEADNMMAKAMRQNQDYADKIGKDYITKSPAAKFNRRWQLETEAMERKMQKGVR